LARFQHAYTRREANLPREERSTLFECRRAHLERIRMMNEYFVELFVKTRRRPPKRVILDLDATDDETHGGQQLTLFHGYYGQHQYYPLLVFEGETGFPLGAWLRHGTAAASLGAAEEIERIVEALRAVWPNVEIIIRGDGGFATPEVYGVCERLELKYAFGYSSNSVLKRRTELTQRYAQALCELYDEKQQFFQIIDDYQADGWPHPRPIIAKLEAMPQGANRRFVVSNLDGSPAEIYHGFYVQRGNVPERPIGQLKNGLGADRLSSPRFLANAAEAAVPHVGLRHLRVVSRGERIGSRSGRQRSRHAQAAVVQSGSRRRNQRAANLDSLLQHLAQTVAVDPHPGSRRSLPGRLPPRANRHRSAARPSLARLRT
jgi:hypothetical protein